MRAHQSRTFGRSDAAPCGRESEPAPLGAYWALDAFDLLERLRSTAEGLSEAEASERLRRHGANLRREHRGASRLHLLIRQVRSPLLLLLVFAAAASVVMDEWLDAGIVGFIVVATIAIGYSKEYRAQSTADALRARLHPRVTVLRDRQQRTIPAESLVPGDVIVLAAGSIVPADAVLLEATDFYVNEAVLTGESFPARKAPGTVGAAETLRNRTNCIHLGANVRSGMARALVVVTGTATMLGTIEHRLTLAPPETQFDRGIRHFGYLLTSVMSVIVLVVFAVHVMGGRTPADTLLFSVALAVGLSPELLPAILSVNLATAAQMMSRRGVLVRRLSAIENLGSMDVLCTDKTGTLTEGVVRVEGAYDPRGQRSSAVLEAAARNAVLETGVASPLDAAIADARTPDLTGLRKRDEIPFDFVRKRVTIVVQDSERLQLLTKGAFREVLNICTRLDNDEPLGDASRAGLQGLYEQWTGQGLRVLAVAGRDVEEQPDYSRDDERELRFLGFLTFLDTPKEGVAAAIRDLAALGVAVKLITGDSRLVAQHVAALVGIPAAHTLTGAELDDLHDDALPVAAARTEVFAEVDPNQKERIILALKKRGHVVGFLGDGVNDAPGMHAADTSLSVEHAVDVAREAADFVLLERSLDVIRRGIEEGRKTFANTLKYIQITTSANLGNMVSMAAVSLVLPFLPLTAGQILLNNFLSDVPAVGLASDRVDPELVDRPQRWDIGFIGRYMVEFGLLSSVFDVLTFAMLVIVFKAPPSLFRTAWFVESLLTELVVALVVRTRRPFLRSRPGFVLIATTCAMVVLALVLPFLPYAGAFGFVPLPGQLLFAVLAITILYVGATELQKSWFYRRVR